MEHSCAQETTWDDLLVFLKSELKGDYSIDVATPHMVKVTRRSMPDREAILNFCGSELFIHYDEAGRPVALPRHVSIGENGALLDLKTNSPMSQVQIVSQIRGHLAA